LFLFYTFNYIIHISNYFFQLYTLFNHVKIVMTICNHPFTTKKNLKFTLNSLINQKHIISHQIHKKTTYHIENLPKIKSLFSKHYDTTIHRIINITKDEYLTTAMQHSVRTTFYSSQIQIIYIIVFVFCFSYQQLCGKTHFINLHTSTKHTCSTNY